MKLNLSRGTLPEAARKLGRTPQGISYMLRRANPEAVKVVTEIEHRKRAEARDRAKAMKLLKELQ